MSTDFPFATLKDVAAALPGLPVADEAAIAAAAARNAVLTKPAGALGRLEALAEWIAGWQGTAQPTLDRIQVTIFAGNHGVAAAGVSAFPAEVTRQMVLNFEAGGAAINQLSSLLGASMTVHALDLDMPTKNIMQDAAMDEAGCLAAMATGWRAVNPTAQLLIPGEMGIGNTTVAAAMACRLFGGAPETWVGVGTGVDADGLSRKTDAVADAVARHGDAEGLDILRRLGGRELAAIAGAVLAARHHRIPVLLDGFIATSAVAPLADVAPGVLDHCQVGHVSAEPGHQRLLAALGMEPLLDLGLRLGEGSGAAVAAHILRAAVACQSGMASFDEAGVADG